MARFWKILLSAFVVVAMNDVAIGSGFFVWGFTGGGNQAAVQLPIALGVSVTGVLLWLLKFERWHRLDLQRDALGVFLLVFPVGALHFVPIHYLVTGYLTSSGNLVAGALFALCANAPAIAFAATLRRREEPDPA